MYKNLIFDLGGVVVNYNPKDYLADTFFYEKIEKRLYEIVFASEEWQRLDMGELSFLQANEIFMKRAESENLAFEMRALLDNWTDMLSNRQATNNLMRIFKKQGYQLYYLSNISHEVLAMLKKRNFWPMFDGGIASCEVGLAKPNPTIYRLLLETYKLDPRECIFADDRKDNALAAFEAGITGIQFFDVKNFCKMLIGYGITLG